ncbi:MAG TPA: alpha/beta fold hydrolase [Solirubrobacteraceae bacterium]|nr:alpha/beta fold hydrolase [Solirubrobacteraceae bacterium]
MFAVFHPPARQALRDTAVFFCAPFGWDDACAYRPLRDWAARLAADGYGAIRFSYPGTGDSGGSPHDPSRVDAWTAAAGATASWVSEACAARRVVAVGIGLGGVVAYEAAAAGAPIDDLVLWGAPARARALVRQLRAFSKLEESHVFAGLEPPAPLDAGDMEAGGFLLCAETVRDLEALDLTATVLPDAARRRVLLLERDGIAADARLTEHLEASGAQVTVAPGRGYAALTSHPQRSVPPREVMARVAAWLGEASEPVPVDGPDAALAPRAHRSAEIEVNGTHIKETPITVPQSFGDLAGILTEPAGHREPGLCLVLVNAGAVRAMGPNRMWVELARRWAARGVPTFRLDVEGIGDADGPTTPYADDEGLYVGELVPQVLAALDVLQERGVGDRFVLAGLCGGAFWCFHAALRDPRVSTALMLNPRRLFWDPALTPSRDFRWLLVNRTARQLLGLVLNPATWLRIHVEDSGARVRALLLWMLAAPKRAILNHTLRRPKGPAALNEFDAAFDRLEATGKRVMVMFSGDEPLDFELTRSGQMAELEQRENVTLESVEVRDHTCRPIPAQREVHAILDRALQREVEENARFYRCEDTLHSKS